MHDRSRQDGHERDAHQLRASPNPRSEHRDHTGEQQHRHRLAERHDHRLHEAWLGSDQHEGVRRTVGVAAGPLRRRRVGVDEQHRRQEEDGDQQHDRGNQTALGPGHQAAGGEREDEIDEQRLDEPAEDPAGAVENVVARLGKCRERPGESREDEQLAEPCPVLPLPGKEADGDRMAISAARTWASSAGWLDWVPDRGDRTAAAQAATPAIDNPAMINRVGRWVPVLAFAFNAPALSSATIPKYDLSATQGNCLKDGEGLPLQSWCRPP